MAPADDACHTYTLLGAGSGPVFLHSNSFMHTNTPRVGTTYDQPHKETEAGKVSGPKVQGQDWTRWLQTCALNPHTYLLPGAGIISFHPHPQLTLNKQP